MENKKKFRERILLIIILHAIVLACFTFWYLRSYYRVEFVQMIRIEAQNGIYDLTKVDFSNSLVRLQGDIEYLPGILSPKEYKQNQDKAVIGYPSDIAAATSYMKIKVPDDQVYLLTTESVNYAHKLYIGDNLRHQSGVPAENAKDFIPSYVQINLETTASDGIIEIFQQGSNFVHRENGGHGVMYIGKPEIMHQYLALLNGLDYFKVGLFFSLFFVHLILYIVRRNYRANLTFSLLCLTWMIRVGLTGSKVFYALFPTLSWQVAFRVEYLSLPIACVLLVLLVRQVFNDIAEKWFVRTVNLISLGFVLLCLVTDTVFMSWALLPFEGFFTIAILYLIVCFIKKVPKMIQNNQFKTEQTISLIAYAVFMYATINDVLYHLNLAFPFNFALTDIAMLIFSFFQMTAMFYGTMREIALAHEREQRAEAQSAMLEEMNHLKSTFYTEMSHEMKTPLTVISINAQFVAQNIELGIIDGETVVDLNAISAEAKRLSQMVTSMVGLGKMQGTSGKCIPLAIDNLLSETARIYQSLFARKNNTFTVSIDSDLPMVEGNADQIIQVLINLLANANRHTKNGIVSLKAAVIDNKVKVSVIDNGAGIPPELLSHVFERYYHGKDGGAGLGLPICKSIIEEHGGEIGIDSQLGRGTKVWFTLLIRGSNE